jgi:hypothetical protein
MEKVGGVRDIIGFAAGVRHPMVEQGAQGCLAVCGSA